MQEISLFGILKSWQPCTNKNICGVFQNLVSATPPKLLKGFYSNFIEMVRTKCCIAYFKMIAASWSFDQILQSDWSSKKN